MTADLPAGRWSELLVGHHWPTVTTLDVLRSAEGRRDANRAAHESYAEHLAALSQSTLAEQQGVTADAARARFRTGQSHAQDVAERNRVKSRSYRSAIAATESLRDELTDIAARGNTALDAIASSTAPAAAKTAAITAAILEAHAEAAARSALHAGSVYAALQSIVDAESLAPSARAFASAHGLGFAGRLVPADLTQRIAAAVQEWTHE